MEYCTAFINYSPIDWYFYYRIINLYASLFGKENIYVLLFEDFVHQREKLMKNLCGILRIDEKDVLKRMSGHHERQRNTARQLKYHKIRNSFFRGVSFSQYLRGGKRLKQMWLKYLEGGPPADGFVSDYWRSRIVELYREDNSKLALEYGLPLKHYDYPMSDWH